MLSMDMFVDDIIRQWHYENAKKEEEKDVRKSNILDHTKIAKLKSSKNNDWVAIVIGTLFVASVAGLAAYQSMTVNDDVKLSGFSKINFQEFHDGREDVLTSADSYLSEHLPGDLIPIWYTLYMYPDISARNFTGLVKIRTKCIRNTSTIRLHSISLKVHKVAIKTVNTTDIEDIEVKDCKHYKKSEMILLSLNQHLKVTDEYDVYIGFSGLLTFDVLNGLYISSYKDGVGKMKSMVAAVFKPTLARKVFPCFDQIKYRAKFNVIIQHHKNMNAVANAPVKQRIILENTDMVETHFEESPVMSTFQLSFVVSEYKQLDDVKIGLFYPAERSDEGSSVEKFLPIFKTFYEQKLAVNYTYPKIDFISTTLIEDFVSETVGVVQIYEPGILFNVKSGSPAQLENVAQTIARGYAKQWFGCLVTTDSWKNEWLMTSLSTYLSTLPTQYYYLSWDTKTVLYRSLINAGLMQDVGDYIPPLIIHDNDIRVLEATNNEENKKGACMFHMLAEYLGNNRFEEGLTKFLRKHKNRNAGLKDFLSSFSQGFPDFDVVDFLRSWLHQSNFPLLSIHPSDDQTQLIAEQQKFQFLNGTDDEYVGNVWRIPLYIKYSCKNETKMHFIDSLTERFPNICKDNKSWYKANYGASGFYRVNYDNKNWRSLLNQLNENHLVLPAVDRANLLSDIFELANMNHQKIGDALDFTLYLHKEFHHIPYSIALTQLKQMTNIFQNTEEQTCIEEHMLKLITPVLDRLNAQTSHNHLEKQLIALLTNVAVSLRKDFLVTELENIFLRWLISSEKNIVPGYMREVVLKTGVLYGNHFEYEALMRYYQNAISVVERDLILKSIASSQDERILHLFVKQSGNASVVFIEDELKVLTYVCENMIGQVIAWPHVQNHWGYIYANHKNDDKGLRRLMKACLSQAKSSNVLNEVVEFQQFRGTRGYSNLLKSMRERILWNIHYKKRIHEVRAWFKKVNPSCLSSTDQRSDVFF